MVRLPRNEKHTYWLNPGTQMWPLDLTLAITLTLNFQGQIWNLLYLKEKWSDCYETKNKISIELQASNVTNGFDLGHDLDIWVFKVKCDLDHWWPRSGVRIYQIGTGVTSNVGVPSTHLVRFWSRSVDLTNFGGILTQWNISNVWFPYLMDNAWQLWPEISLWVGSYHQCRYHQPKWRTLRAVGTNNPFFWRVYQLDGYC